MSKRKRDHNIVPLENTYGALQSDDEPYDFSKKNDDLILNDDYQSNDSDSSDDSVIVESDDNEDPSPQGQDIEIEVDDVPQASYDSDEGPRRKIRKENDLSTNKDFIGFGFESSDEEAADDLSDDGVISNDEGDLITSTNPSSLYPWIKAHDHSTQKEIADWLTMEIKDFINYISPSKEEIIMRNNVVNKLKEGIRRCWPDAEAHVFGSYATDLYLPGSDIDIVVISQNGDCENRHKLYQLSSFLRQNKLAREIEVIAGAKVPIIKFIEPESNIQIDVSFERTNGIDAAKRISKWIGDTKGLRELVMVVKQFLRSRKLNNVHVGGLGGYATIILCYHFLRLHPRISTNNMNILDNLGSLLIEFFELYGRNFSYDNLILAIDPVTDLPKYLKKSQYYKLITSKNPFSLVVQDPSDPDNNITRSSYNLRDIKKAFGGAYQLLTERCYQLNSASYKSRIGQSILGDIIRYKGKERDFNDERDLVMNHALVNHEKEAITEVSVVSSTVSRDGGGKKAKETKKVKESKKETKKETKTKDTEKGKPGKVVVIDEPKEYFSEVTIDTESEPESKAVPTSVSGPNSQSKTNQTKPKNVADFVLVESESEEEEPQPKKILDKDAKRDYWRQKGLEL
ncbi:poly(A) RNA polymerase protein 1 [[Candida] jaroonii]|uniref:Poly(A) RNA polymerase protein 1 n=1 Tax=[Candida] jaroonii TaxID=467808 RepID=A0ACA9Y796_9ASCO|nr:poly(A) RNA polymerase protein 1 [[Candida] jaroonii]